MLKVYDCSNSSERPSHRGSGGPKENDIVRYLKAYCKEYDCLFVDYLKDADIVFTNDIFTRAAIESRKPLVKRADGCFWQEEYRRRNTFYISAIQLANHVIFISEYSQSSYRQLYPEAIRYNICEKSSIIHNRANHKEFYRNCNSKYDFCASASNWNRPEKRLKSIIRLAELFPEISIILIGSLEEEVPNNIHVEGYIHTPEEMNYIMGLSRGFVNFSYRDALTKTIPQAFNCGLPVLYHVSGGVPELFYGNSYGYGICDTDIYPVIFEDSIPDILDEDISRGYMSYTRKYGDMFHMLQYYNTEEIFRSMLFNYFKVFHEVAC